MDPNERKLETMDDLRAAMESPEVRDADARMSQKFLKNNRPKSLAVVIAAVAAAFLLLGLSSHRASSVTPVALRTADTALVGRRDGGAARPLSPDQREALLALLDDAKVRKADQPSDGYLAADYRLFTFRPHDADDWFALDEDGYLYLLNHSYRLTGDAAAFWEQLDALLAP